MSVSVLASLAGAVISAAVASLLGGRAVRNRRLDVAVWAVAVLGLVVSLAAQADGFAAGFSPLTFRAAQLGAQLIAPLWLAWGQLELVIASAAGRFAARLISSALTVVAGVVLTTDPLSGTAFTKSWPRADQHFQLIAHYALLTVQVAAVAAALGGAVAAALRARGDGAASGSGQLPLAAALASLAVLATVAVRFTLPAGAAYPLLCAVASVLVWLAMTREPGRNRVSGTGFTRSAVLSDAVRTDTGVANRAAGPDKLADNGTSGRAYAESGANMRGRRRRDDEWDDGRPDSPDSRRGSWTDGLPEGWQDRGRGVTGPQDAWTGAGDWQAGNGYQGTPGPSGPGPSGFAGAGYGGQRPATQGYPDQAPGAGGQGFGAQGYGEQGYAGAGYGAAGYGAAGYGGTGYGAAGYGEAGSGDAGYGAQAPAAGYGQPGYSAAGVAAASQAALDQTAYDQTAYDQAAYGQGAAGQPAYGQAAASQPTFHPAAGGQPAGGYPGYGDAAQGGYGDPGPGDGRFGGSSGYGAAGQPGAGYQDAGYGQPGYDASGFTAPGAVNGEFPGPSAEATAQYGRLPSSQAPGLAVPEFTPADSAGPANGGPGGTPRPYGRLSIFTLLDDKVAEFDRLAELAAEGVRTTEPDTLVYVIHVVPKAPMQRIIYEIYRDRPAFENHERQPHIQRFVADRRSCVLATNIIDLRLKYAKVAALATPQAPQIPQSPQETQATRTPRALEPGARGYSASDEQHAGTGQRAGAGQYASAGSGRYSAAGNGSYAAAGNGRYSEAGAGRQLEAGRYGESGGYPGGAGYAEAGQPPRPGLDRSPGTGDRTQRSPSADWDQASYQGQGYGGS